MRGPHPRHHLRPPGAARRASRRHLCERHDQHEPKTTEGALASTLRHAVAGVHHVAVVDGLPLARRLALHQRRFDVQFVFAVVVQNIIRLVVVHRDHSPGEPLGPAVPARFDAVSDFVRPIRVFFGFFIGGILLGESCASSSGGRGALAARRHRLAFVVCGVLAHASTHARCGCVFGCGASTARGWCLPETRGVLADAAPTRAAAALLAVCLCKQKYRTALCFAAGAWSDWPKK